MTGVCQDDTEARHAMEAVLTNDGSLDRFRAVAVQQGVKAEVASALVNHPERGGRGGFNQSAG